MANPNVQKVPKLLMQFNDIGDVGIFGAWGVVQDPTQTSVRLQALQPFTGR